MPNGLLGLNCRTLGVSRDQILSAVRQIGCAWVLVQDDPELVAQLSSMGVRVIYRQSNDETLSMSPDAFVAERHKNAPSAAFLHLTNELDPTPELLDWTRRAIDYATPRGIKLCLFNFSTDRSLSQWQSVRDLIRLGNTHGHATGLHVYLKASHGNDASFQWQALKRELGGLWLVTEYAWYIDAYHGWGGTLNPTEYSAFFRDTLPLFEREGMPLLGFSGDDWPLGKDEQGRNRADTGFGMLRSPDLIREIAVLNTTFTWSDKPVTTIPPVIQIPPGTHPVDAVVNLVKGVNLRSTPDVSTDANIIKLLPQGERVTVYEKPSIPVPPYTFIRVDSSRYGSGFSAQWVNGVDSFIPYTAPPTPTVPMRGIDVSEAQGVIDWVKVKAAGVQFAMIRATQGTSQVDKRFDANVSGALDAGLHVSAYHAVIASQDGAKQAAHFLKVTEGYWHEFTLLMALDVELTNQQPPAHVADVVYAAALALEDATGELPYIYTSLGFWNGNVGKQHDDYLCHCPLWLAAWGNFTVPSLPRGFHTWQLWQWSNKGSVDGVKGRVDLDRSK